MSHELSHVKLFVTLWTVAFQASLSMGILQARLLEWVAISSSRGSSWPTSLVSPALAGRVFTTEQPGKPLKKKYLSINLIYCMCLVAQSWLTLCKPLHYSPPGSSVHGDSPGKNAGVGCHALLQRIFPTQGLNPGLPHCRQILYCLSHERSPYRCPNIYEKSYKTPVK